MLTSGADANRTASGTPESGADCCPEGTGDGEDDDSDTIVDDGCPSVIYQYDDADRLESVADALGRQTSAAVDENGNRVTLTNPRRV